MGRITSGYAQYCTLETVLFFRSNHTNIGTEYVELPSLSIVKYEIPHWRILGKHSRRNNKTKLDTEYEQQTKKKANQKNYIKHIRIVAHGSDKLLLAFQLLWNVREYSEAFAYAHSLSHTCADDAAEK